MKTLAAFLIVLWVVTAVAVSAIYRPGGPVDIVVVLACLVPVAVATMALVWPSSPAGKRDRLALVWIWLTAVLFAIPVLYGVVADLVSDDPVSLIPSVEAAYAAIIAFGATALFSAVGFVHTRRGVRPFERAATMRTLLLAGGLTVAITASFGAVAAVNDRSQRDDGTTTSRFGPTDADLVPPDCDVAPRLGEDAVISIEARSSIDNEPRGEARLDGRRGGADETWGGTWSDPDGGGDLAYRRVASRAWVNSGTADPEAPGTTWRQVTPDGFGMAGTAGLTMDGPPHAIVSGPRGSIVPEDLGLAFVEGAQARHCRTFIDGPTALATFLPLRWLVGDGDPARLDDWRGEMDWWVFTDGELGRASVEVSGSRAPVWAQAGVRGTLEADLLATDRDQAIDIGLPAAG